MLFVNNVRENATIKIVNEEVVNKVTELKALSLGFTACNKLLQVRNYCTTCKETSYYAREILTVLTIQVHVSP